MELRDQLQRALGDAYTLQRELGGGGMSRVFVARETLLDRDVVLKVPAPELAERPECGPVADYSFLSAAAINSWLSASMNSSRPSPFTLVTDASTSTSPLIRDSSLCRLT